jgi:hypothetical protein
LTNQRPLPRYGSHPNNDWYRSSDLVWMVSTGWYQPKSIPLQTTHYHLSCLDGNDRTRTSLSDDPGRSPDFKRQTTVIWSTTPPSRSADELSYVGLPHLLLFVHCSRERHLHQHHCRRHCSTSLICFRRCLTLQSTVSDELLRHTNGNIRCSWFRSLCKATEVNLPSAEHVLLLIFFLLPDQSVADYWLRNLKFASCSTGLGSFQPNQSSQPEMRCASNISWYLYVMLWILKYFIFI